MSVFMYSASGWFQLNSLLLAATTTDTTDWQFYSSLTDFVHHFVKSATKQILTGILLPACYNALVGALSVEVFFYMIAALCWLICDLLI